jgi:8-amino-7-oxononanoate synthase
MDSPKTELAALSAQQKRALLEKVLKERGRTPVPRPASGYIFPAEYAQVRQVFDAGSEQGAGDLFFRSFDGINNSVASASGTPLINYCSYNYLGMSGDPDVSQAAIEAIRTYGTSVSASRVVSGERPIHRQLEQAIADWVGAEDAVVFVGGFTSNVDTIGHLFGKDDLIVYDSLIHASAQQGARLSGALAVPFPHNNMDALDSILQRRRKDARQVLIVVEGIYSMDGDIADLPRLIEIKTRQNALLMVDEAHSIGVLGRTGRGIGEHFGTLAGSVDLWMGTLSKSFASCGGYIAGSQELVTYLRRTAPGFVYSVGISPPNTAAALASLQILKERPERLATLRARTRLFHTMALERGLDIGEAHPDSAVMPIMTGDGQLALKLSRTLLSEGILALPIGFPAVPENKARLRFFISSTHSEEQIRQTIDVTARSLERLLQRG